MSAASRNHKKARFLLAYQKFRTVRDAAKAARSSEDSIYDWLKNDSNFRESFQQLKSQNSVDDSFVRAGLIKYLAAIINPFVPDEHWGAVHDKLFEDVMALDVSNPNFNLSARLHTRAQSRKGNRVPSVGEARLDMATRASTDGARLAVTS